MEVRRDRDAAGWRAVGWVSAWNGQRRTAAARPVRRGRVGRWEGARGGERVASPPRVSPTASRARATHARTLVRRDSYSPEVHRLDRGAVLAHQPLQLRRVKVRVLILEGAVLDQALHVLSAGIGREQGGLMV